MKVNITGRGIIPIPGIGTLAPRYNVELDKRSIEQLLNCTHLTVTEHGTNLKITKTNIDGFFNPVTVIPVANPIEVPKETKETYVEPEIKIEKTAIEIPPEPVPIEPVEEFVIDEPDDITLVEEPTPVVEKIGNVIEPNEEEPKKEQQTYNKKQGGKRKRH